MRDLAQSRTKPFLSFNVCVGKYVYENTLEVNLRATKFYTQIREYFTFKGLFFSQLLLIDFVTCFCVEKFPCV